MLPRDFVVSRLFLLVLCVQSSFLCGCEIVANVETVSAMRSRAIRAVSFSLLRFLLVLFEILNQLVPYRRQLLRAFDFRVVL